MQYGDYLCSADGFHVVSLTLWKREDDAGETDGNDDDNPSESNVPWWSAALVVGNDVPTHVAMEANGLLTVFASGKPKGTVLWTATSSLRAAVNEPCHHDDDGETELVLRNDGVATVTNANGRHVWSSAADGDTYSFYRFNLITINIIKRSVVTTKQIYFTLQRLYGIRTCRG